MFLKKGDSNISQRKGSSKDGRDRVTDQVCAHTPGLKARNVQNESSVLDSGQHGIDVLKRHCLNVRQIHTPSCRFQYPAIKMDRKSRMNIREDILT